jgi:hypothetical protein
MKIPADDALRERLRDLGRRDAATAPSFARVLRGRAPAAPGTRPRPRVALGLQRAATLAGLLLLVLAAWWWPLRHEGERPLASRVETTSSEPPEEWGLPTDGLLPEPEDRTPEREAARLSREIEGLLQP